MTEKLSARRATVDDLPQLVSLWRAEQWPAEALEKRLPEFQVVCDEAGRLVAALGVQLSGTQALLHSESIARAELSDTVRELLWNRVEVIVRNNGLERLWTQLPFTFWKEKGFEPVPPDGLASLPAAFPPLEKPWFAKTLRAALANATLDKEWAHLKALQQQEAERMKARVQWMKRAALIVTVIVFGLVVVWAVTLLSVGPKIFNR
jgi:hypothetical protein